MAGDLTGITSTSEVFYLQENEDGLFEVYFGDDIIGKQPKDSDLVSISFSTPLGLSCFLEFIFLSIDKTAKLTHEVLRVKVNNPC